MSAGYAIYLLYSLLIAPLMILLAARSFGSLARPVAATVAAFGMLLALARAIGILRWLTVMPVLATAHTTADPAARGLLAAAALAGMSLPALGLPFEVSTAAAVSLLSLWMLMTGVGASSSGVNPHPPRAAPGIAGAMRYRHRHPPTLAPPPWPCSKSTTCMSACKPRAART